MRWLITLLGFLMIGGPSVLAAPAIEDPKSPKAILENAVKAYGGAEKMAKLKTTRSKAKGSIDAMGLQLEFTTDMLMHENQMKMTMSIDVGGNIVAIECGFDGETVWMQSMGQSLDLPDQQADELKEGVYVTRVTNLVALLNDEKKEFKLETLGESKVDDKTLVGLKVSSKGHKDVKLFFDKETGFLVRYQREAPDPQMNLVEQTTIMSDFKDFDGVKQPTKVKVMNGNDKFMEMELTELSFPKKVDVDAFKKPRD